MATRITFTDSLVNAYRTKSGELTYKEARRIEKINRDLIEAYQSTPEWVALKEMATKVLSADWAKANLRLGDSYQLTHYLPDLCKVMGLIDPPVPYANPKVETLLIGALTTTRIKFWDGWFPPVNAYLDAIKAATTNEEIDEAIMTFVQAL